MCSRVEERLREDSAAGRRAHLGDRSYAASTHRGHFLAKGDDVNAVIAEIWAKRRCSS